MQSGRKTRDKKPTMAEVAAAAGVSQTTVSLVLNNTGGVRVSEETRDKVRSAAQELGYFVWQRNNVGSGSIRCIGLLVDDIESNPLSLTAIDMARKRAWANDCVLNVLPFNSNRKLEKAAIDLLLSLRLVGVIYQSFYTRKVELPKALRTQPIVLVNCYSADQNVPYVVPGHRAGAYVAVEKLIAAGHRRIGCITGAMEKEASGDRLQGYLSALRDAGLPHDPTMVRVGDWNMGLAERETVALMQEDNPPTAIFCASDRMAIGCYEALKGMGYKVPQDVSVVGFDGDPVGQHLTPPLSSVHVPHGAMGASAVDYLIARANHTDYALRNELPCDFIERESIAPVAAGRLQKVARGG
ncbi:LacI family DNA-binding transcriptional regulator [Pelagovum pacificum]|nr:LacI family DNA-binding transcriptional regulator [Pelagovum pacificum]QQA43873.1 LacI family DNA-binding transcriptional regulator [Pelagovum pacificum]